MKKKFNKSNGTPFFVNFLRIWLAFVAIMAFGNTFHCFMNSTYLYDRLYTVSERNVSGLAARLFGIWTLLSGIVRLLCGLFIYNRTLYIITLLSFVLALGHFTSEVFIYNTASLTTAGIIAPLIVSSLSITLMILGYYFMDEEDPRDKYVDENEELLKTKGKKPL
ncbi:unnamed protein product [Lymnaea stagnalis]|uniref:Ergosterol biosynthetic protein 28 n=1 Tax=Lymnaea stagnalis TaxID=6523 RepID=A0AAV2HQB1_LYMST